MGSKKPPAQDQCAAHNRPMLVGEWEGLWCGFYVPELGVCEDYGCWIDEGTDGGY